MNKKGFTIIELLAVIIIMAVIITSIVLTVGKMGDNTKVDLYEVNLQYIRTASKEYAEDNINLFTNECTNILVYELIDKGYLVGDSENKKVLLDPRTNESMNNIKVCIKYINGKVEVEVGV